MLERTRPVGGFSEIVEIARQLIEIVKRSDGMFHTALALYANSLCANLPTGSRYLIPKAIDDGKAISTIVRHKPKPPHPPTTEPRVFDTLFFAALILMEMAFVSDMLTLTTLYPNVLHLPGLAR